MGIENQNVVDIIRSKSKIVNHVDLCLKHLNDVEAKIGTTIQNDILNENNKTDYNFATIEVHPTNRCNQKCWFCSYNSRNTGQKLSWNQLARIKDLKPKTITLVGGGDPTLYRDGNYCFNDIVSLFTEQSENPIKVGVITNGVFIPSGDWQNKIDWIRISLDAANENTYFNLKKINFFFNVIQNIKIYIKSRIPAVGIGFLAQKRNIGEFPDFLKLCFELDGGSKKVNVQQRLIHGFPDEVPNKDQLEKIVKEVKKYTEVNSDFGKFVEIQTNFNKIANALNEGKSPWRKNQAPKSKACFYSLLFALVNANGDIYPCRIMSESNLMRIGHIDEPVDNILDNRLELFKKIIPSCCTDCCRDDKNNFAMESALNDSSLIPKASKHNFI